MATEPDWEIWYQDLFDAGSPRRVEATGQGLVEGLVELWTRHLAETVTAGGTQGFSRFNLWLKRVGKSVEVVGDWEGQLRLRGWVFGDQPVTRQGRVVVADRPLLRQIAKAHEGLLQTGGTSEELLRFAKDSRDRADFLSRIANLKG